MYQRHTLVVLLLLCCCVKKAPRTLPTWLWQGDTRKTPNLEERDEATERIAAVARHVKPAVKQPRKVNCAGALFTHGTKDVPDTNARDLLLDAIASAPKGAKLYMVMFQFDQGEEALRDTLIQAATAGVEIHVIVDEPGSSFHQEAATAV